ncbi:MAG: hypothetical protein ACD_62C00011G0002 [uncultured bacterium]|nr:MAG: hypothetical protein ACD_62C00011G0002 [uncultured bacterium]
MQSLCQKTHKKQGANSLLLLGEQTISQTGRQFLTLKKIYLQIKNSFGEKR